VILALVGCLLVAVSIGQLARRLPSAGGFYTYASRGLHPSVGFLVGWGYAFVDATVGLCETDAPCSSGGGYRL
jgi:amino acid transporter